MVFDVACNTLQNIVVCRYLICPHVQTLTSFACDLAHPCISNGCYDSIVTTEPHPPSDLLGVETLSGTCQCPDNNDQSGVLECHRPSVSCNPIGYGGFNSAVECRMTRTVERL